MIFKRCRRPENVFIGNGKLLKMLSNDVCLFSSDQSIRPKFRPDLGPVSSTLEGTILLNIAESSEDAVLKLLANGGTFSRHWL